MSPIETAAVVVVDPRGHILVVDHPRFGQSLPGGHLEDRETPAQAAVREVLEETGLHCRLASAIPLQVTTTEGAPSCAWFAARADGEPSVDGARWCPPAELVLPFAGDAAIVADALGLLAGSVPGPRS
jgi:8-oxo-dGTP diphosphatase